MSYKMLVLIRIVHTFIWVVMASSILFVMFMGIVGRTNNLVWLAISLVFLEGLILLANGWICPLRKLALKYDSNLSMHGDIYLPKWLLFRGYTILFSALFLLGLILVIRNQI